MKPILMPINSKKKMPKKASKTTSKKKTAKKNQYIWAVGRRKTAVATIKLYLKQGEFLVNEKPINKYFPSEVSQSLYFEPLKTTNLLGKVSATFKVRGSGKNAQLYAVIHALSRALNKLDKEKYHLVLKKKGFLTRDSRMKERRKPGYAQKARAKKQSPKR